MKAGMSGHAELFIKAEEAPVTLMDQGRSQTAPHMLPSHTTTHTSGAVLALLICYVEHGDSGRDASESRWLYDAAVFPMKVQHS